MKRKWFDRCLGLVLLGVAVRWGFIESDAALAATAGFLSGGLLVFSICEAP